MSPDDVLAAALWPWPDPLLKRDRAGHILFVNAAFLQLHGGRVEDWAGRTLTGWPAPNPQGAQRFETRTGEGAHEAVYDWVENVMADGNTMAVARNVTALIAAAVQNATPAPQPRVQTQAPTHNPAPATAPIAPQPATVPETAAPQNTLASEFEDTLNNDESDYSYTQADATSGNISAPQTQAQPSVAIEPAQQTASPQAAPAAQAEPEEERMIERRALPIEDSTSVLGSNWRDQVIAKAIGADTQIVETQTPAAPKEEPVTEAGTPPAGRGLNILLAEDNAINALLTRTLLEADGAIVETVEDGALAVEAVRNKDYDLIFMDMRMPNMDGLESTRKIRALGKTMPIVALTANAFDDDRNSCFDSGMNDFMTKPVSAEELTDMVATWVKNGQEAQKRAG